MIKGVLVLTDELDEFDSRICSIEPTPYDFGVSLYIDSNYTLEKQLNNKELIVETFDDTIKFLKEDRDSLQETISIYEYVRNDIDNFYDNIEYIALSFTDCDYVNFIEQHPIIQNKKIVLPICLKIDDHEKILELLSKYDKYKDNIYIMLERNLGYVSLNDCLNTINKMKELASSIVSLNLSPMETIMYTYDLVRNREYVEESGNESAFDSRDLCSVLFGDKIVCVGFSNMFTALLNFMNIKCYNVGLDYKDDSIDGGHERNVIYVQDLKYGIDGVYYFDPTWDCKKEGHYNEFLNSYKYFAKTRSQMMNLENNSYLYKQCQYFSDDTASMAPAILSGFDGIQILRYADSINYMAKLVGRDKLIEQSILLIGFPEKRAEFLNKLNDFGSIQEKFNKPIPAEVFIRLLNNVRRVQHYQNPEFYPYTINSIYSAYFYSKWQFNKHYYSSDELFLRSIFGEMDNRNHKIEDFRNFINNENISLDIEKVESKKLLKKTTINN